ncbi:hypothetical protein L2E82_01156 [Cichorium intybus]|uniref:Uncharacterized protein n=1 Tax=Cichorium intybus TaxID=13427 RepID=A0ACB9GY66_CICIN|nr:hypothetical protein L2E82_01156 [Cichorium intybus]
MVKAQRLKLLKNKLEKAKGRKKEWLVSIAPFFFLFLSAKHLFFPSLFWVLFLVSHLSSTSTLPSCNKKKNL